MGTLLSSEIIGQILFWLILIVFAALCWYRLHVALVLLPLALPYYLLPITVFGHYRFSATEIVLWTCAAVALVQWLVQRERWPYRLSWRELRDRLGPFTLPILVFLAAALISVWVAFAQRVALRSFREEVFDPLLYLVLLLLCLRTRPDIIRLLAALLASSLVVSLIGLAQYFLFKNQLVLEADGIRRVHAVYGSANSIGLFLDYTLPLGLAVIALGKRRRIAGFFGTRQLRVLAVAVCIPLLAVLYLSQSRGAWVAIAGAALFILLLPVRSRKALLVSLVGLLVVLGIVVVFFHKPLINFMVEGHSSVKGISTLTKRLYLWESALRMIRDHPWLGVGMDNWLCYYSYNHVCFNPALLNHHYWILFDPMTKAPTGLADEPTLSHPHNIFLHVWVSMGIFGLLAFVVVLGLFFWLFTRILMHLRTTGHEQVPQLLWMTVGVGAAMLAALVQGMVDSAFLEQDLAFCFWILVAALLLLRMVSGTSWWGHLQPERPRIAEAGEAERHPVLAANESVS